MSTYIKHSPAAISQPFHRGCTTNKTRNNQSPIINRREPHHHLHPRLLPPHTRNHHLPLGTLLGSPHAPPPPQTLPPLPQMLVQPHSHAKQNMQRMWLHRPLRKTTPQIKKTKTLHHPRHPHLPRRTNHLHLPPLPKTRPHRSNPQLDTHRTPAPSRYRL